jgi:hypothetical protein
VISTNKIGSRHTQANPTLFYLRVMKLGKPQFGAEISDVVRNSYQPVHGGRGRNKS